MIASSRIMIWMFFSRVGCMSWFFVCQSPSLIHFSSPLRNPLLNHILQSSYPILPFRSLPSLSRGTICKSWIHLSVLYYSIPSWHEGTPSSWRNTCVHVCSHVHSPALVPWACCSAYCVLSGVVNFVWEVYRGHSGPPLSGLSCTCNNFAATVDFIVANTNFNSFSHM